MEVLKSFWKTYPLRSILILAFSLRLIAVFFAPGYLMHDDHFLTVEAASSWAEGEDYDNWLPWNQKERRVHPANFAYVGTQYVLFAGMKAIGLEDPKIKMILIRLIHALYSLLIVYFGFKITERISNRKNAQLVGVLLAVLAIMPNFSVRNLVEFICIPPLVWATWNLIRIDEKEGKWMKFTLLAGIGIGLATGFRFQCGVFGIGAGLALLFQKKFKSAVLLGAVALFTFALAQIQDVFIWGEPFTQLKAYIGYNETHSQNYPNGPWYMYMLTLAGFITPPLSLALLFGFFRGWKKHLLVFLPAFAFLVFHSFFPNKQERFIFPIIPYIIILGVIGWNAWAERSSFWANRKKLLKGLWTSFWVINTLGLLVLCFSYGKRSRVESMSYLYEQGDATNFIAVHLESSSMPPKFYANLWASHYWIKPGKTDIVTQKGFICRALAIKRPAPNYLLFYGDKGLDASLAIFESTYPGTKYLTTIHPGGLDRLLNYLNPRNTLETVHIYKLPEFCD
jgi:hypothetical protein